MFCREHWNRTKQKGATVLCGLCEVVVSRFDRPPWNRALFVTGDALSAACVAIFIAARQPYAGIVCFALLVAKTLVSSKHAVKSR